MKYKHLERLCRERACPPGLVRFLLRLTSVEKSHFHSNFRYPQFGKWHLLSFAVQMITLQTGSSILEILNDEFRFTAYWKCAKPLWDNGRDVA